MHLYQDKHTSNCQMSNFQEKTHEKSWDNFKKNESTGNGLKTHKKIEGKYFLEAGKKTLKTGKQTPKNQMSK